MVFSPHSGRGLPLGTLRAEPPLSLTSGWGVISSLLPSTIEG